VRRDKGSRDERIEAAIEKLEELKCEKRRGPKTEKALKIAANKILERFKVSKWIKVEIEVKSQDSFVKTSKGAPAKNSTYRKQIKKIPFLTIKKDLNEIARSAAIDGLFPLTTNANLSDKETLEAYKYQPNIEKQFAFLKSDLQVAPLFLKNNIRIEAMLFCCYLACLISALVQRKIRKAMKEQNIAKIRTLPEDRETSTPTWEQIQRLFAGHCKYHLQSGAKTIKIFNDELTEAQKTVITMMDLPEKVFT